MKVFCLLVVLLPLMARAQDPSLKAGGCPVPPAVAQDIPANLQTGVYKDQASNYELAAVPQFARKCPETKITADGDGDYKMEKHYIDASGAEHTVEYKFKHVDGQPGRFRTYLKDGAEFKDDGWVFTVVGHHGDSVTSYGCKEIGDQHKDLFIIRSVSTHAASADTDILKEKAKTYGDNRAFVEFSHENCNYKY